MLEKKNKKILIVGGTGFLGYHAAKFFIKKNYKVISISRNRPKKNRKLDKVKYLYADISQKKKLFNKLRTYLNIGIVINFGGEVDHSKSMKIYNTHYKGTKNLIEFFDKQKIQMFVQIGSSMEYGKSFSPQKETFIGKPNSNYAKAKFNSTKFLRNKKNFPSIILRLYQVYGPKQDTNRLVPITIGNCLKNKNFACSDGNQFRDFLYIDDFVNALYASIKYLKAKGEVFNVGYGKPYRVKNVINFIKNNIKKGKPEFGKLKLRKEENKVTYPSINKIKKILKWRAKISLNNGLKKTIRSYK